MGFPLLFLLKYSRQFALIAGGIAAVLIFRWWIGAVEQRGYDRGVTETTAQYEAAANKAESDRSAAQQEIDTLISQLKLKEAERAKADSLRVAAVRDSLRARADRPASVASANAAAAGTCGTGAGLYREDGGFLIGEAAAAARIVGQRDTCYSSYSGAQLIIEELRAKLRAYEPRSPTGGN